MTETTKKPVRNQVGLRIGEMLPGSTDNGEPGVPVGGKPEQNQSTDIEAFRSRVEEAIISEINDQRNASASTDFRQGLRVARIILNREAEAVSSGR